MPEGTVFIGRPTAFGNPFVVGVDGSARECVEKYAKHLLPYQHHGEGSDLESLYHTLANIEWIQRELRGKDIACWCRAEELCHGDVLLEIANMEPVHDH